MENSHLILKKIITLTYLFLIIAITLYNYVKPYYTYDLVPYTAATISLEQSDPVKVHEMTYSTLKESVPPQIFSTFTNGTFGEKMLTDATSFNQQLNYYTIKPLYIYSIFILHKLGFGIVNAVHLISAFSFLGICILLYFFIHNLRSGGLGLLILSILLVCQPLVITAGRNTPDTLSAFIITLALFLLLRSKLKIIPGILLVLSIAVRPDNLIISSILILYFGIIAPKQYRFKFIHAVLMLLASASLYFSINHFEHAYGWKTLFTIAFLHFVERPAEVTVHLSIHDYFRVLFTNGLKLLNTHMFEFIILGLMGLVAQMITKDQVFSNLVIITFGVMFIYFILFPSTEVDRYFITEYLFIIIASLHNVCSRELAIENKQVKSLT